MSNEGHLSTNLLFDWKEIVGLVRQSVTDTVSSTAVCTDLRRTSPYH